MRRYAAALTSPAPPAWHWRRAPSPAEAVAWTSHFPGLVHNRSLLPSEGKSSSQGLKSSSLLTALGRVAFVGDSCGRELFFAMLRILEPACRGRRVEERKLYPIESGGSSGCEEYASSPTAWCNMSNTQPFAGHVPREKLQHPRCRFETALGGGVPDESFCGPPGSYAHTISTPHHATNFSFQFKTYLRSPGEQDERALRAAAGAPVVVLAFGRWFENPQLRSERGVGWEQQLESYVRMADAALEGSTVIWAPSIENIGNRTCCRFHTYEPLLRAEQTRFVPLDRFRIGQPGRINGAEDLPAAWRGHCEAGPLVHAHAQLLLAVIACVSEPSRCKGAHGVRL